MQTDRALIRAMLDGDEAAFRRFFEAYFPRLQRFALPRLAGDGDACKEVVQSTLIKAVRSLASFRGGSALFSWLCQICRHQIVDYLRTHKRHTDLIERIDDSEELRADLHCLEAPVVERPLNRFDAAETRRLVRWVLDNLPRPYADVLTWKYLQERSVHEISGSLGIGQVAAQSILARARIAFRVGLDAAFGPMAKDLLADMRGD